ncbi:uncharacterized protein JCM15063_001366 [Sporobolomyces koalae]|uniref:uncharacterized protein n=1 Tax=Sporobolomyces koalae TaxID=500713 RepID=UPI00317D7218
MSAITIDNAVFPRGSLILVTGASGVVGFAHIATSLSLSTDYDKVVNEAVQSTLVALRAAHAGPTVKRFVLISSAFTVAVVETHSAKGGKRYGPEDFNSKAIEMAKALPESDPAKGLYVYSASETEGELAAWEYLKENKQPSFEFSTIQPAFVVGAILDPSQEGTTTAGQMRDVFMGRNDFTVEALPRLTFIPVQDVATLHVAALLLPTVKNRRLIACPYPRSWKEIFSIFKDTYPLQTLPPLDAKHDEPVQALYDNKDALKTLLEMGQETGWTSLEQALEENVGPYV